jgi:hypothetical protein
VGDDFGVIEQLVSPDVIRVFVGIDDPFRHRGPYLIEQLNHPPRVCEIRLRINYNATAEVDKPGVRITNPVPFI